MVQATTRYIAASANRFSRVADISPSSSTLIFGSSHLLAVWNLSDHADPGITEVLSGHQSTVTCVRFLSEDGIVSADEQGHLLLWRRKNLQWEVIVSVPAHKSAISALTFCNAIIATSGSDAVAKIWTISELANGLEPLQTLNLQGKYALDMAMTSFPQSDAVMLCVAGTDSKIHIWISTSPVEPFTHTLALSGHEDWVKCLSITSDGSSSTLASGSQDGTIRLWKIETNTSRADIDGEQQYLAHEELLDTLHSSWTGGIDTRRDSISSRRHFISLPTAQFCITFDALLVGHEEGITSLNWRPQDTSSRLVGQHTLLSTSNDSSVIMWSPSSNNNAALWISRQRFGDVGGQRLGGFMGGLWGDIGRDVYAWGWGGGFRRWRCSRTNDSSAYPTSENWREIGAITGHRGPVKGISWSARGDFLVSCGLDQTVRVHAEYAVEPRSPATWHEIARPQVHGYDMSGVVFLDSLRFASAADEKVVRVFDAPYGFVSLTLGLGIATEAAEHDRPLAANVPPLGLSNKAMITIESAASDNGHGPTRRPFEGELSSTTLWPEIEKVFGHGYELIALAVSPSKSLLVTACKATTAEHAVIRVYRTSDWSLVGDPLEGHTLTVTRIAFSPDETLILSVSRDRTWRLFERTGSTGYLPVSANKAHARIIWDCAWAPDGATFVTVARDRSVKVWSREGSNRVWSCTETLQMSASGTAIDIRPSISTAQSSSFHAAVGLDSGDIVLFEGMSGTSWTRLCTIRTGGLVQSIQWRPYNHDSAAELATCSEDGTVRIIRVRIT